MKYTIFIMILLFIRVPTHAQCTKDTECKGNRICVDGKCVDPEMTQNTFTNTLSKSHPNKSNSVSEQFTKDSSSTVVSDTVKKVVVPSVLNSAQPETVETRGVATDKPVYKSAPKRGFALATGIVGTIFAPGIMTLGIIAAVQTDKSNKYKPVIVNGKKVSTNEHQINATVCGSIATGALLVATPLIAVGSHSAHGAGGCSVNGCIPLKIIGWVLYGLSIAQSVTEMAIGWSGQKVPPGLVMATTITAFVSMTCHTTDAYVSFSQAGKGSTVSINDAPFYLTFKPTGDNGFALSFKGGF